MKNSTPLISSVVPLPTIAVAKEKVKKITIKPKSLV